MSCWVSYLLGEFSLHCTLWQSESKCALVYGQMNEPPGARARVGLTGLTVAEHFRDAEGQDVLLFIDNIFRFTQVDSPPVLCPESTCNGILVIGYADDISQSVSCIFCLDSAYIKAENLYICYLSVRRTLRCLLCLGVFHLLWDTNPPLLLILEDCRSGLPPQRRVLLHLFKLFMCLLMT